MDSSIIFQTQTIVLPSHAQELVINSPNRESCAKILSAFTLNFPQWSSESFYQALSSVITGSDLRDFEVLTILRRLHRLQHIVSENDFFDVLKSLEQFPDYGRETYQSQALYCLDGFFELLEHSPQLLDDSATRDMFLINNNALDPLQEYSGHLAYLKSQNEDFFGLTDDEVLLMLTEKKLREKFEQPEIQQFFEEDFMRAIADTLILLPDFNENIINHLYSLYESYKLDNTQSFYSKIARTYHPALTLRFWETLCSEASTVLFNDDDALQALFTLLDQFPEAVKTQILIEFIQKPNPSAILCFNSLVFSQNLLRTPEFLEKVISHPDNAAVLSEFLGLRAEDTLALIDHPGVSQIASLKSLGSSSLKISADGLESFLKVSQSHPDEMQTFINTLNNPSFSTQLTPDDVRSFVSVWNQPHANRHLLSQTFIDIESFCLFIPKAAQCQPHTQELIKHYVQMCSQSQALSAPLCEKTLLEHYLHAEQISRALIILSEYSALSEENIRIIAQVPEESALCAQIIGPLDKKQLDQDFLSFVASFCHSSPDRAEQLSSVITDLFEAKNIEALSRENLEKIVSCEKIAELALLLRNSDIHEVINSDLLSEALSSEDNISATLEAYSIINQIDDSMSIVGQDQNLLKNKTLRDLLRNSGPAAPFAATAYTLSLNWAYKNSKNLIDNIFSQSIIDFLKKHPNNPELIMFVARLMDDLDFSDEEVVQTFNMIESNILYSTELLEATKQLISHQENGGSLSNNNILSIFENASLAQPLAQWALSSHSKKFSDKLLDDIKKEIPERAKVLITAIALFAEKRVDISPHWDFLKSLNTEVQKISEIICLLEKSRLKEHQPEDIIAFSAVLTASTVHHDELLRALKILERSPRFERDPYSKELLDKIHHAGPDAHACAVVDSFFPHSVPQEELIPLLSNYLKKNPSSDQHICNLFLLLGDAMKGREKTACLNLLTKVLAPKVDLGATVESLSKIKALFHHDEDLLWDVAMLSHLAPYFSELYERVLVMSRETKNPRVAEVFLEFFRENPEYSLTDMQCAHRAYHNSPQTPIEFLLYAGKDADYVPFLLNFFSEETVKGETTLSGATVREKILCLLRNKEHKIPALVAALHQLQRVGFTSMPSEFQMLLESKNNAPAFAEAFSVVQSHTPHLRDTKNLAALLRIASHGKSFAACWVSLCESSLGTQENFDLLIHQPEKLDLLKHCLSKLSRNNPPLLDQDCLQKIISLNIEDLKHFTSEVRIMSYAQPLSHELLDNIFNKEFSKYHREKSHAVEIIKANEPLLFIRVMLREYAIKHHLSDESLHVIPKIFKRYLTEECDYRGGAQQVRNDLNPLLDFIETQPESFSWIKVLLEHGDQGCVNQPVAAVQSCLAYLPIHQAKTTQDKVSAVKMLYAMENLKQLIAQQSQKNPGDPTRTLGSMYEAEAGNAGMAILNYLGRYQWPGVSNQIAYAGGIKNWLKSNLAHLRKLSRKIRSAPDYELVSFACQKSDHDFLVFRSVFPETFLELQEKLNKTKEKTEVYKAIVLSAWGDPPENLSVEYRSIISARTEKLLSDLSLTEHKEAFQKVLLGEISLDDLDEALSAAFDKFREALVSDLNREIKSHETLAENFLMESIDGFRQSTLKHAVVSGELSSRNAEPEIVQALQQSETDPTKQIFLKVILGAYSLEEAASQSPFKDFKERFRQYQSDKAEAVLKERIESSSSLPSPPKLPEKPLGLFERPKPQDSAPAPPIPPIG